MKTSGRMAAAVVAVVAMLLAMGAATVAIVEDFGPVSSSGSTDIPTEFPHSTSAAVATVAPTVPERIAIPVLSVYAPVAAVGQDISGGVVVPNDIARIGWYRGSELLGSAHGTTVLVGHRDGHDIGAGAFFGLDTLHAGDRVLVAGAGSAVTFTVVSVDLVDKNDFAKVSGAVFTDQGDPRLVLISCGGAFDFDIGSYESNVIVTAVPSSSG